MTTRAPSEVWEIILKYSISVPFLFDPDEVMERFPRISSLQNTKFYWSDTRPYWESERQRNTLQCVCKHWDNFLRMFEHRFVQTIDIISEAAFAKAIRVYFNDMGCGCESYCSIYEKIWRQRRKERYCRVFGGDPPMRMEIAHVRDKTGPDLELFHEFGDHLTNLKTLLIPNAYGDEEIRLGATVNRMPNLRHIVLGPYIPSAVEELPTSSGLISLALEDWSELTVRDFEPKYWQLPSLRHLILPTFLETEEDFVLLRIVGSGLLSLELRSTSQTELPSEIWTLCPNLLRLRSNHRLTSPPPPTHPIHTLYLTEYWRQFRSPKDIENWTNLRTIIIDLAWIDEYVKRFGPDVDWKDTFERRGIRFEDMNGQSLDEYLDSTANQGKD